MADEQPNVEEPKAVEPTAEPTASPEAQALELLKTLDNLGVSDPAKLEGMATASAQAGNLANKMGEKNTEIAELKAMIQNLGNQSAPQNSTYEPDYGESIDIGKVVRTEVKGVVAEMQKAQADAEGNYYHELAEIQSDPDFAMVSDAWAQHTGNPNVVAAIRGGRTTMSKEYDKLVRTYQRELLKQSTATLRGLTEKGVTAPPHVESGDTHAIPLPSVDEEQKVKLKNITDPGKWTGSDSDIKNLVKTILPDDDPIFKM